MADLTQDISAVAGAAASGPLGAIAAIIHEAKGVISDFVPDPNAKLAGAQRLAELQIELQEQQNQALTEQVKAMAAANSGGSIIRARSVFCYSIIFLYLWNYAAVPLFHRAPVDIPMNLNVVFATIMLGFVGVPAAMELISKVIAQPGDTSLSVLGMKVGNKS